MPMNAKAHGNLKMRGFTLLEMLVALLVLSFGLLGIAGLQATSLRQNNNTYMRTQANILAYDVVDRMRANRGQAIVGGYNIGLGEAPSGSSLAATDLMEWKYNLAVSLTNGDGGVSCSTSGLCTVTVQWDEIATDGDSQQFVLSSQI